MLIVDTHFHFTNAYEAFEQMSPKVFYSFIGLDNGVSKHRV